MKSLKRGILSTKSEPPKWLVRPSEQDLSQEKHPKLGHEFLTPFSLSIARWSGTSKPFIRTNIKKNCETRWKNVQFHFGTCEEEIFSDWQPISPSSRSSVPPSAQFGFSGTGESIYQGDSISIEIKEGRVTRRADSDDDHKNDYHEVIYTNEIEFIKEYSYGVRNEHNKKTQVVCQLQSKHFGELTLNVDTQILTVEGVFRVYKTDRRSSKKARLELLYGGFFSITATMPSIDEVFSQIPRWEAVLVVKREELKMTVQSGNGPNCLSVPCFGKLTEDQRRHYGVSERMVTIETTLRSPSMEIKVHAMIDDNPDNSQGIKLECKGQLKKQKHHERLMEKLIGASSGDFKMLWRRCKWDLSEIIIVLWRDHKYKDYRIELRGTSSASQTSSYL